MKWFKKNLWPPGGRYFIDEDGIKHKGDNWQQVVLRVTNYRKRAGKPPGDPEGELKAQVCARLPELCRPEEPKRVMRAAPPVGRNQVGPMTERVLKWIAEMLREARAGRLSRVSAAEAARRAAICAQCPMNRQLNQSCGTCKRSRADATKAITGKAANDKLGGCKVLHTDNGIAVWLELPADNRDGLPGHCWRRG